MTDSKGKLTDPAWLKNELNWARGTNAEMKEAMLNQWTESHEGLVFKPEAQRRIRDQQEDKSALNSLVNEFLDSSKSKGIRYRLHLNGCAAPNIRTCSPIAPRRNVDIADPFQGWVKNIRYIGNPFFIRLSN